MGCCAMWLSGAMMGCWVLLKVAVGGCGFCDEWCGFMRFSLVGCHCLNSVNGHMLACVTLALNDLMLPIICLLIFFGC